MLRAILAIFVVLCIIQLIPYGWVHSDPHVRVEPAWSSPETRALAKRACFDCHSNETYWPWYSSLAPVSWLVQHDVEGGRRHLNFSEWNQPQRHAKDTVDEIQKGDMPPWYYLPMHPPARLTASEKEALINGLQKMSGF